MSITFSSSRRRELSKCAVREVSEGDKPGLYKEITDRTNCTGEYSLRRPKETRMLKIWPTDGHWSMIVEVASPNDNIRLISTGDVDFPWWQVVVGAKKKAMHSAKGIRIGVIDLLFQPEASLKHVKFLEPDRLIELAPLIPDDQNHGRQVTAILSGRGPGKFRGLASKAEIFFLDASVLENGRLSAYDVDHARVRDGILNLAQNHKVDVINLSCGFGTRYLPDLKDAVEEAADLGTLCICAAGNSNKMPVEVPASYKQAIAVGGVGFSEVADIPTIMGLLAAPAKEKRALGAFSNPQFGKPFLDPGAAWGPEVDVLAPSMGVVLKSREEEIIDCFGTSYAAPIVSSVLACALANDQIYQDLKNRPRYEYARRKLGEISVDLAIPRAKNPAGFPVLQR